MKKNKRRTHGKLSEALSEAGNLNQKHILCRHAAWRMVNDQVMVLNTRSGDCFSLNGTGTEAFLDIIHGRPLEALVSRQQKKYKKSHGELTKDITGLLRDLAENKIIKKAR